MKKYILTNNKKNIAPVDVVTLFKECGWGSRQSVRNMEEALQGSDYTVFCKNSKGKLIGLLRVAGDGMYSNVLDIVVHPRYSDKRIGAAMIDKVKAKYKNTEIYISSFTEAQKFFFINTGFKLRKNNIPVQQIPVFSRLFTFKG